jgi:hypothetical protein
MARRQQAAEMETYYTSRLPELAGVEFATWQEGADAEDRIRKLSDPMGALDPIKQEEARQAQVDAASRTAGDAAAAEYSKVAPAVATYKANKPLVEMEDKQAMDQIAAAGAARKANPITLDESSRWGGGPSMRSGSGADSVAKFAKIQAMSPQERERAANEKFALPETTQEILARGDELNTSLRGKAVTEKAGGEDRLSVARSLNLPAYTKTSPAAEGIMKDIGADKVGGSRGATVYELKKQDLMKIREMPDGPEKEAAFDDFILNSATGTAYGLSDEGIDRATKRSAASASAISPIQTQTAVNTAGAVGTAKALTPEFKQEERAKWSAKVKDFTEAAQQYSLGANAKDDAIGDVALINALEKVREINSAVMYGDYTKWQRAGSIWDRVGQDGLIDAATGKLRGTLTPEYRREIRSTLEGLFANRQQMIEEARNGSIDIAKNDYGWDDATVNRIYSMPKFGMENKTPPKTPTPGADSTGAIKYVRDPQTGKLVRQ